ncbi:MAG TPA: hypothetical protein VGB98_06050, partial [Pyrinomonadaceae bacterium]
MNNDLGRTNDYTRNTTRDARQGAGLPADGAGQRANVGAGLGPARQEAATDSLNELLTNRLLSALPAEDFSRLFQYLEPVSLAAGDVLYKLDAEMRHAYFPETAVVSHLYILSEGSMTEAD